MRTKYLKLNLIIATAALIMTAKVSATTTIVLPASSSTDMIVYDNQVSDDANFKVTVIKDGSEINVHISLNAAEGMTGVLKIYNALGQLVSKNNVQLKQLPDYYTLNLNEYSDGTYTFELTTSVGVHYTHPIF